MTNHVEIHSAHPLSPFQEGLLFHALKTPESDAYLGQEAYRLEGPLSAASLELAWQRVIDRHPALRSAVVWEGIERALQVVFHQASPQWTQSDWNSALHGSDDERLASLMHAERLLGIDVSKAPLLRLHLARVGPMLHYLIITQHHLIMDGWSYGLVLKEVMAHYHGLLAGRPLELPEPPSYRDYVDWLATCESWRAEEFWRTKMHGYHGPTALPYLQPASLSSHYEVVRWKLTDADTQRLTAFTRGSQLTLNTVVQGVWALVLSQFAGNDVVFGTPVSLRPPALPGSETIVGPLMNTVPVRVRFEANTPVSAFLARLQQEQHDLQDFAFPSLVEIQGWTGVDRREPLFNSLVVVENYPTNVFEEVYGSGPVSGDALSVHPVEGFARTHYPLTIHVLGKSRTVVEFVYDSGGFTQEGAQLLVSRFRSMLERIIAGDGKRISEPLRLSADERAEILEHSTGKQVPPADACCSVPDSVAHHALNTPDVVAVQSGSRRLTYRELDDSATLLATVLIDAGVGPEVLVAVYLPRDWQAVVAILAILRAGAAFVPIDGDAMQERVNSIVKDSGCAVAVTDSLLQNRLPAGSILSILVDEVLADDAAGCDTKEREPRVIEPESLAYVIYTSGSSGKPKGVAVTHGGLSNYLRWAREAYDADAGSGAPLHSSLGFDLTITSLFLPLIAGKRMVVTPSDLEDAARLVFVGQNFSFVKLTPSHMRAFAELGAARDSSGTAARSFIVGGEQLMFEDVEPWRRCPTFQICNEYGPTETVVGCTMYAFENSDRRSGPVPIGRPIANTRAFVVDDAGEMAPFGSPGELYIGGAGVARGYLNDPAQTAEKFVPDPYSGVAGARLYRSGDQVRWLANWQLEYIGRLDNQVKIRGHRVELGEIEAVLAGHSDVRCCCVVALRDESKRELRLAGYVVSRSGQLEVDEIRRWAESRLPDYMVPFLHVLEELPLSANGKVDRKALPSPDWRGNTVESVYELPISDSEQSLAEILQELLDREVIGRNENFFRIGMHSLLATQLISRVQTRYRMAVPLRLVFEAPTIAELASKLDDLRSTSPDAAVQGRMSVSSTDISAAPMSLDDLSEEEIETYLASLDVRS